MTDNHIVKPVDTNHEIESTQMHPLVKVAMRGGAVDTQTLKDLMELQKEWEKHEAKKAYTQAMVQLKAELPSTLEHDKKVDYPSKKTGGKVNYTFSSLAHAMNAVSPHLTQFGFSLSWTPTTDKMVSVTCRLTHTDGHYEEATLSAQPDMSGAKNSIQAIGSTISYLQRYTALSLLGIATADMKCVDEVKGDATAIDATKNLEAVAWMQRQGIHVGAAEEHVGKKVQQWTAEDLASLRTWIEEQRKPAEPAELSEHHQRVIEAAEAVFGDDAMPNVMQLCRANQEPFSFAGATRDQLQYLENEINAREDQ